MRKAKPRKKEKQKLQLTSLSEEDSLKLELALYLTNISEVTKRHLSVWDREIKDNDGYLDGDIKINLDCIISTSVAIREKYLWNVDLTPNLSKNPIISKCMALCCSCFGEKLEWTIEDREQRLPRGFMGTIGALARTANALVGVRFETIQKKLGMLEDIFAIGSLVESYLNWVYREITFKNLIKSRVTDEDIKKWENAILYQYNKAVKNGEVDSLVDKINRQVEKIIGDDEIMACATINCKYKKCRYHIHNDYRHIGYARTVRVMENGELCKEEKKRIKGE